VFRPTSFTSLLKLPGVTTGLEALRLASLAKPLAPNWLAELLQFTWLAKPFSFAWLAGPLGLTFLNEPFSFTQLAELFILVGQVH
jgi:hypothetical protein